MHAALRRLLATPIAHRGLHGCGNVAPVENSIGAAMAAAAAGYGIECDVQLSRDGEPMVFHDDRLERLTRGSGRLAEHDAADLSRLELGASRDTIPTLAAFLAAVRGHVPIVIELKSAYDGDMRLAQRTLEGLAGYDGPVAIESFDPALVDHCRRASACYPLGLVGSPEAGRAAATLEGYDFVSWSIDAVADVAALRPGLPLTTWTVRTQAQRAIAASVGAQIVFEAFAP